MSAVVVIPTYDEALTILPLLRRLCSLPTAPDVLVVDDGSPDGTADLVSGFAEQHPSVRVLRRPGKAGLGAAYRAGFGWALDQGYEVVAQLDADLSHPPETLPVLMSALAEADVVVGSRYVPGGETVGWPRRRELLSRAGNAYARGALRLPVRDATAGFRAYRAVVLAEVGLASMTSDGYCFQVEMTLRAVLAGFTVAEVPIVFTERAQGVSKMSRRVVWEALTNVTGWALSGRVPLHPRVHPASAACCSPPVTAAAS